jgi:hypothetical protein
VPLNLALKGRVYGALAGQYSSARISRRNLWFLDVPNFVTNHWRNVLRNSPFDDQKGQE